jgi:glutamyl aminopeptidase
MVAGHMDEIGFMVKHIRSNGLIEVVSVGGWSPQVISAQRFTLQSKNGDYPIVSSSIPPHLLKGKAAKEVSAEDVLFDAGFESSEEAKDLGIRPGDAIVPYSETVRLANKNRILGKAVDNRYSIAVILEMLEELQGEELPNTLIVGASVQEEVGLRGIQGAVRKFKPDIFLAVDASPANDISGDSNGQGKLDAGFLLRVQDPGMITLRGMREFISETAETEEIPYQYFFSKGGTDAGTAHLRGEGIPATTIGMPARYIHTHQSIFDMRDYQAAKDILLAIVRNLNNQTLNKIKERN